MMRIPKIVSVMVLVTALSACSGKTTQKKEKQIDTRTDTPTFNQDSAYNYIQQQVDFGFRIPNTPAHLATAKFLATQLQKHGAEVITQDADVIAYDNTLLHAKNIIGIFAPEKKDRVLLFAHWDSRPFADHDPDPVNHKRPVTGANDGASGVGVLLEVARQIGIKQPNIGIDIIFFDAEDYGEPEFYTGTPQKDTWALGAQYWASKPHKLGYRARYGILLDMVGGKNAVFAKEQFSKKYAPAVLEHVWKTGQSLGYQSYFSENEGGYITDDHIYVNQAGIPSIDIIEYDPTTETGFNPQWHTVNDNMEHIDKETLKAVGQTILSVIYNE